MINAGPRPLHRKRGEKNARTVRNAGSPSPSADGGSLLGRAFRIFARIVVENPMILTARPNTPNPVIDRARRRKARRSGGER